jgi:hypothetical protein
MGEPAAWTSVLAGLLLVGLGAGCTPDGKNTHAALPVEEGWRYRFELEGVEQVYVVREAGPVVVRYDVETWIDGERGSEALSMEFSRSNVPDWSTTEAQTVVLDVGGRAVTCRVAQRGALMVWTAMDGERVAFPGVVRVQEGERVCLELTAVEEP